MRCSRFSRCSQMFMRPLRDLLKGACFAALLLAYLCASLAVWAQTPAGQSLPAQQQGVTAPMPPAPPQDQPIDARTAIRLSDVEGSVRLYDGSGKLFDQVLQNMAMLPGMTVETANDGRAELEFPDGSVARVTPNSALSIPPSGDNGGRLVLKPVKGLSYYEFPPSTGSYAVQVGPLIARAAQGEAGNRQPVLLRVNLDAAPYQASVLRGSVHFEDPSGNAAYDLAASQTAKIDPETATNYDIVLDVTPDTWDAWNADRDFALAQIASAAHLDRQNDTQNDLQDAQPEDQQQSGPGWNDLNYYGSWYDVPGEGMAWAPDGVGEGFDPYASGTWGYYTATGYIWISSYPWGWLPYHCGVWEYRRTYGWMWLPSGCGWNRGRSWYPLTQVLNPPARYQGPARPSPPGGIHHPLPAQMLIAVQKGQAVRFRGLGEPRPTPRTLMVSGAPVQPVPVESRPSYRSMFPGELRSTQAGSISQPGQMGFVSSRRIVAPASGFVPRSPQAAHIPAYTPAPHGIPLMPAPVSAPHISAPAASGHGH